MKKMYTFLTAALCAGTLHAQTISNAGMETWRTGVTGGIVGMPPAPPGPIIPIEAPNEWFGFDSLTIALGESYGYILSFGDDYHQQVFQETTFKNSGTSSAKIMTVIQDGLGPWAGSISNAVPNVNITDLLGGADPLTTITYNGGTHVTDRILTVSAWVAYFAGKDEATGMMGGPDEGMLTAQAIAKVGAFDSIVGTGSVNIGPSATFTQVTANLTYTTTDYDVHTVRIIFASSNGSSNPLDSSTLYADDITMTGEPQAVRYLSNTAGIVNIYPNPAKGTIHLSSTVKNELIFSLLSISGRQVAKKNISGDGQLDISKLAAGLYLYSIADKSGQLVQNGNISVIND